MKQPAVGVGVLVWKNNQFLIGKRVSSHGHGAWSPPGGKLEYFESWEECARREVAEEAGIKIKNCKFLGATNDTYEDEDAHFVTIFISCEWDEGEPKVMEPDKIKEWKWVSPDKLPDPLFKAVANLKKAKPELFQQ